MVIKAPALVSPLVPSTTSISWARLLAFVAFVRPWEFHGAHGTSCGCEWASRPSGVHQEENPRCCLVLVQNDSTPQWFCQDHCPVTMYEPAYPVGDNLCLHDDGNGIALEDEARERNSKAVACEACSTGCRTCSHHSSCNSCLNNFLLHIDLLVLNSEYAAGELEAKSSSSSEKSKCEAGDRCKPGFYRTCRAISICSELDDAVAERAADDEPGEDLCVSCPRNCTICEASEATLKCLECQSAMFIQDLHWIIDDVQNDTSLMPGDHHTSTCFNGTSLPASTICVPHCNTVENYVNVTEIKDPTTGETINSTRCDRCNEECIACHGREPSDCERCKNYLDLDEQRCVAECELMCPMNTELVAIEVYDLAEKGECRCVRRPADDGIEAGTLVGAIFAAMIVASAMILTVLWATGCVRFRIPPTPAYDAGGTAGGDVIASGSRQWSTQQTEQSIRGDHRHSQQDRTNSGSASSVVSTSTALYGPNDGWPGHKRSSDLRRVRGITLFKETDFPGSVGEGSVPNSAQQPARRVADIMPAEAQGRTCRGRANRAFSSPDVYFSRNINSANPLGKTPGAADREKGDEKRVDSGIVRSSATVDCGDVLSAVGSCCSASGVFHADDGKQGRAPCHASSPPSSNATVTVNRSSSASSSLASSDVSNNPNPNGFSNTAEDG